MKGVCLFSAGNLPSRKYVPLSHLIVLVTSSINTEPSSFLQNKKNMLSSPFLKALLIRCAALNSKIVEDSVFGKVSENTVTYEQDEAYLSKFVKLNPDSNGLHFFPKPEMIPTDDKQAKEEKESKYTEEQRGERRRARMRNKTEEVKLASASVVTQSLVKLRDFCENERPDKLSEGSAIVARRGSPHERWFKVLRDAEWAKHVRNVLEVTKNMVMAMLNGKSVVAQSHDGRGSATQLASLVQLCMDPYYRTIIGFAVLVEKEWESYGTNLLCHT